MANEFKERSIKYLNKDFQSIKRDLIEYTKSHHGDQFQDFNESSPGMALLELTAYVGDVLSFYQDMQFLEIKQQTARQIENVASFAKSLGYRPSGKRSARGIVSVFIEVPATVVNNNSVHDTSYCPVLKAGSKLEGPGTIFETLTDVDFSKTTATYGTDKKLVVAASQYDQTTSVPTHFALLKDVEVVAAETVEDTFSITDFQAFRSIELQREDVVEILSVTDSDGNYWYEVDYLPQELIFDAQVNNESDSSLVPYVLKLIAVPRRFITDRDPITNKTTLIFGSGDGTNFDDELIPNIANLSLPTSGKSNFTTFSLDPQNFLKTRTLGLSPFNTTLTVTYRVGGGAQTNLAAGSIRTVNSAVFEFSSTSLVASKVSDVKSSVECYNEQRTTGGGAEETAVEIKANSSAFFAAQNRTVTREDYISRVLSMPQKFGKVDKVFVRRDAMNELALDIHVLARDENNHLCQASQTLSSNIKKYLSKFRMLTDGVNILTTEIVNLKVDFGVVIAQKFNRNEVLSNCLLVLKDLLSVDKIQVAQPLVISNFISELQNIDGVISVYDFRFSKAMGSTGDLSYSDYTNGEISSFDVQANLHNGILYCPENSIFQIKYPNVDIRGESK